MSERSALFDGLPDGLELTVEEGEEMTEQDIREFLAAQGISEDE